MSRTRLRVNHLFYRIPPPAASVSCYAIVIIHFIIVKVCRKKVCYNNKYTLLRA